MISECIFTVRTPVAVLQVSVFGRGVTRVTFGNDSAGGESGGCRPGVQRRIRFRTELWFEMYFQGRSPQFTPLLKLKGTSFQHLVWSEIRNIPPGSTRTYGEVAKSVGNKHASRAVGQACGGNPIPILIPCHRVVAEGSVGGYTGPDSIKRKLLKQEGAL